MRQRLVEEAKDVQRREIITFLYHDHPQGASFDALKEMLFLHDAFEESQLTRLVEQKILAFDPSTRSTPPRRGGPSLRVVLSERSESKDDGKRYTVSADARQVLDRDATILMDEFLRE